MGRFVYTKSSVSESLKTQLYAYVLYPCDTNTQIYNFIIRKNQDKDVTDVLSVLFGLT